MLQRPPVGRPSTSVSPLGLALCAALLAACSSSDDGGVIEGDPPDTTSTPLTLLGVDGGFGPILPHRAPELDSSGMPTGNVTPILTMGDLAAATTQGAGLLPPTQFPTVAVLPSGQPGNHYFAARFSRDLDLDEAILMSVQGSLAVRAVDTATGALVNVPGRFFAGGLTLEQTGPGVASFEQWVDFDPSSGRLVALVPEANGFPGVISDFGGAEVLADDSTIVFVPDLDDNLGTFETFPLGTTLRLEIPVGLLAAGAGLTPGDDDLLQTSVVATSHVGQDAVGPEVLIDPLGIPLISPSEGDVNVDPATTVRLELSESVQPNVFGSLTTASLASGAAISQGLPIQSTPFPYTAAPDSVFDLTRWTLTPVAPFAGLAVDGSQPNSALADVTVAVAAAGLSDLAGPTGNTSAVEQSVKFRVGPAPGLANVPVVPEAIFVMRGGTRPGLSVIDMNGFGQSTGSPIVTGSVPGKGETRWPFNPNVLAGIGSPGISVIDGGSAGVFSLTRDTNLDSILASAPVLEEVSDLHLGYALDTTFNNAPPPFGCSGSGGYLCAMAGLKSLDLHQATDLTPGFPNLVSYAPLPNPPKLMFPPQCTLPLIGSESPVPADIGVPNLLVGGDPFGDPQAGIPPSGVIRTPIHGAYEFSGPSAGQTQLAGCAEYGVRNQIGQFLYAVDRQRSEVVCLNSNRTTPIERFSVPDATSLAIGPNLDVIAVSNQAANAVTIIDVNPLSATFHQVIATVTVPGGPRGLAFEPHGEDLLVCCGGNDTVAVIDPTTWSVRNVSPSLVSGPFEIAVTPRMLSFSFARGVYYGYVLGRDGRVAVYESGPNGVNGWGFDDTVGIVPFEFKAPRTIVADPLNLDASVYIAHEGPIDPGTGNPGNLGDGAVSRLRIESALTGQIPLGSNLGANANFRDLQFSVPLSIAQSSGELSGIPVDLAFDNMWNEGGLPQPVSPFGPASGVEVNGKCTYRSGNINTNEADFLFAAVPGVEVVDVIALGLSGARLFDTCAHDDGVQSIPAPGVRGLCDYWRQ